EGGVEGEFGGLEVERLDEAGGFAGAGLAVHAAVFPLHGERALVAPAVERSDDLLEVDSAAPRRAEIPSPPRVPEVEVRGDDPGGAVQGHDGVLDVDVVDAVAELVDEARRADALPVEVARVEVEAERRPVPDRRERAPRGDDVVGDLGGVDLQPEAHPDLIEDIQDRVPAVGEVLEARLDLL